MTSCCSRNCTPKKSQKSKDRYDLVYSLSVEDVERTGESAWMPFDTGKQRGEVMTTKFVVPAGVEEVKHFARYVLNYSEKLKEFNIGSDQLT